MYWLNVFPTNNDTGKDMRSKAIVQVATSIYCKHLNIILGSYAQVHLGTTNTMREITIGVIALNKSNEQGGFYLILMST